MYVDVWYSYVCAGCVCRWGRETFEHLVSLVHSEEAVQAGVQLCYAHCLFLAPEPDPFWSSSVHGFRRMSEQELQVCRHMGYIAACVQVAGTIKSYWCFAVFGTINQGWDALADLLPWCACIAILYCTCESESSVQYSNVRLGLDLPEPHIHMRMSTVYRAKHMSS